MSKPFTIYETMMHNGIKGNGIKGIDDIPSFGIEVLDDNNRIAGFFIILPLSNISGKNGSENSLREGRFHSYTDEPLPFKVTLPVYEKTSVINDQDIKAWFEEKLEWLADNSDGAWGLDIDVKKRYEHQYLIICDLDFNFLFENISTAMHFKLLFT